MKKIVNKIIVLALIFIVAIAAIFIFTRKEKEEVHADMGESSLPIVTFLTTGAAGEGLKDGSEGKEIEINQSFGYTTSMDKKYMRDSITPINESRKFTVRVNNFSNVILGASFELRTLDSERLIEDTNIQLSDITVNGDYTNIAITFDNIMDKDTEYLFVLKLKTDRHDTIYFYTRIIILTDNYCAEEMEFANMFSNATLDEAQSENIIGYLEPKASKDNTNLGEVDINSNFNQITWGNIKPQKVTQPVISIKEILGQIICLELKYKVSANNDYDTLQYYNVTEFLRIRWTSTDLYLLNYKRSMDQIFEATNQNISVSRINLGIDSDGENEFLSSKSGKYIAFTKENGLWLMGINDNVVRPLFSFDSTKDFDIRDLNSNNEISIISVEDSGDVEFLVYGYMNRGEHEGMVGVALYEYNIDSNIVKEKIFIPFTKPYQILKETVGKLAYVNKKDIMYMMLNDSIYSIDLTGNEYVQIISKLRDGSFAINDSGSMVAWLADDIQGAGQTIRTLNLETGTEFSIQAQEGKKIKILGFVNDDLTYGIADDNMIITDKNGTTTAYMSELRIADMEGNVLKTYSNQGYYFTSAKVESNMINLTRVTYQAETSTFLPAPEYQVFGNEEENTNVVSVATITTNLKKKELVINFVSKVTSLNKLELKYPQEISTAESNALSIRELISTEKKFYVYGYGGIAGIYDEVSTAIMRADAISGVVIDENGNYAWARSSRPTAYTVPNVSIQGNADSQDVMSQLALCLNSILAANGINVDVKAEVFENKKVADILNSKLTSNQAYDLTGCTFSEVLYYVYNGQPVLAAMDSNTYVLIIGYDFYNAVILSPITGETSKRGIEDIEAVFKQEGNKFISIN